VLSAGEHFDADLYGGIALLWSESVDFVPGYSEKDLRPNGFTAEAQSSQRILQGNSKADRREHKENTHRTAEES
jgi:hypothetical protein